MQNVATMRERMFTMRLSEEEAKRLDRLAAHYGLNAAGVIRFLLKREDDAIERAEAPVTRASKKGGAESVRRWVAEAKAKPRR